MAKNRTNQNPTCDKIRKATFGKFLRVDPSVSSKARSSYTKPMCNEIPIEYVPAPDVKSARNVRFSSKNATKKDSYTGDRELVAQKTFGDSKFDSFIGRMKMKMSAPSNVGAVKTVVKHDTFSEKVSNFIDQAKLKFRAASSVGANEK